MCVSDSEEIKTQSVGVLTYPLGQADAQSDLCMTDVVIDPDLTEACIQVG